MEDRKRKGTRDNDWPPESAWRSTAMREVAWWATAPYGREDGSNRSAGTSGALQLQLLREDTGQNAPRSAPIDNEQPGVVVLGAGGGTTHHGLQVQVQAPMGSGIRPPSPMVCPSCRYSFFYNIICVYCACAAAAAAQDALTAGHHGGEAPAFQNLSPGLHQPPQAQWGPVHDEQRCPACCFFPGRMADRPWRHVCRCNVCRFFLARVCLVCVFQPAAAVPARMGISPPQPHHQHPLVLNNTRSNLPHPSVPACSTSSSSSGTWENKLPPAARCESAVGRPAEGPPSPNNSGITAFGRQSRRRIQFSPPTSPPERIAKPVHDDGWCPACLYTRAPTVFQPRTHGCVCDSCIFVDGIVCPVCANFGRPGDSTPRPAPDRKGPFDSV